MIISSPPSKLEMMLQLALVAFLAADVVAQSTQKTTHLRVASFNCALNRRAQGELLAETRNGSSGQIKRVAATLQVVNADVVLLAEVDFDSTEETYRNLQNYYFRVPQTDYNVSKAVEYTYYYAAPSNTGKLSPMDLNGDGKISLPSDAYGYGSFPGQYAFVVYSKYPIDHARIRTFRKFLWKDMPRNHIPKGRYDNITISNYRLSSKNHVDVPIVLPNGERIHVLASHPTPPVFDSAEFDENGRRNADEIRFWSDYITPGAGDYLYDDKNKTGGIDKDERFFIVGDLNLDPYDGDGRVEAIATLLSRYNVVDPLPASVGAAESTNDLDTNNAPKRFDTSQFFPTVGNLRVDYVLPSSNMNLHDAAVFWPGKYEQYVSLVSDTSDHRAVYVDVSFPSHCIKCCSLE